MTNEPVRGKPNRVAIYVLQHLTCSISMKLRVGTYNPDLIRHVQLIVQFIIFPFQTYAYNFTLFTFQV